MQITSNNPSTREITIVNIRIVHSNHTRKINKNDGIIIEFNNNQINVGFTYKNEIKDEERITKKIELYLEKEDKIQINYDEEKIVTPNLKIDKLDANTNCVILNDYPQEELQTLMVQLRERLNQIYNRINEKIMQENN